MEVAQLRKDIAGEIEKILIEAVKETVQNSDKYSILEAIDKAVEIVEERDPEGLKALYDDSSPEYFFLRTCETHWDHWWHDLGKPDFPFPKTVKEMFFKPYIEGDLPGDLYI